MFIDGSDIGLGGAGIDAVHVDTDGSVTLSLDKAINVAGVGNVDDSDLLRLAPTSVGADTAGTLSIVYPGSNGGLTSNNEDIDALTFDSGAAVISTKGNGNVPATGGGALSFSDEDLIRGDSATPTSWALVLDGSASDLNKLTGVSGTEADLMVADDDEIILRRTGGSDTFTEFWNGKDYGFDKKLDAIHVVIG